MWNDLKMSETAENTTSNPSISSAGGSPAKTCPSQVSRQDSPASEADFSSTLFALHPSFVPVGWYSKTYPDYFRRAKGGIWESSSERWRTQGIAARGECWTRSGSESPNAAAVCSLSDILMQDVPQRFYLSQRAARGILRRCEKRGRTLPMHLTLALEELAQRKTKRPSSPRPSSQVGGKQDRTAALMAKTLLSMPSTPTEVATGESTEIVRHLSPTLRTHVRNNSNSTTEAAMLVTHSPSDTTAAKTDVGEGRQSLPIPLDMRQASRGAMMTNNRTDGGPPGTGVGKPGDPSPTIAVSHPPAVAMQSTRTSAANSPCPAQQEHSEQVEESLDRGTRPLLVRRLTPIECERLQGFPDGWTVSDTDASGTQSQCQSPNGSDGES